jgi:hypothetical protein
MHKSQSLFSLIIALHVSGVTITHLQEHKTTVTTAFGNHYTVLLSAAIVEELELLIRESNQEAAAILQRLLQETNHRLDTGRVVSVRTIAADNSTV